MQVRMHTHTHTCTHTHLNQYEVEKRQVLRADFKEEAARKNLISFGSVFQSVGAMQEVLFTGVLQHN